MMLRISYLFTSLAILLKVHKISSEVQIYGSIISSRLLYGLVVFILITIVFISLVTLKNMAVMITMATGKKFQVYDYG